MGKRKTPSKYPPGRRNGTTQLVNDMLKNEKKHEVRQEIENRMVWHIKMSARQKKHCLNLLATGSQYFYRDRQYPILCAKSIYANKSKVVNPRFQLIAEYRQK